MSSSVVQILYGYVSVGAYAVYEFLQIIATSAPQSWYSWMASNKTKLLKLEGYNSKALCGCSELKMKARLRGSYPWAVGKLRACERLCIFEPSQRVSLGDPCALCRLLASSIESLASGVPIPSLTRYKLGHTRTLDGKIADVWGFEADARGAHSISPLGEDAHLLGRMPDSYARYPQQNHASRQCILEWLRRCSQDHPMCQALDELVHRRRIRPKRLINTRSMTIELTYRPVRYLALSYVWGSYPQPKISGLGEMCTGSASIEIHHVSLPKVIEDAIKLTNELGETHVWVDAICINQDDVEEKVVEFANMNEIYLAVTMTIVALDSENANSGLPGVEPYSTPRTSQTEIVEGVRCTTVNASLSEKYSDPKCKWNTRAWTFQEHLFSRRIVFLGSQQAYFSCLTATYAEDRYEGDDNNYRLHNHPGKFLLHPSTGSSLWQWKIWKKYVELYSARHTSVEEDRHHAFQGILSEQQVTWRMGFTEALPINFLPLALYWWHGSGRGESFNPMPHRIQDRPSWTWTGWSGPINFPDYERYRSVIAVIEVSAGERSIAYKYDTTGTMVHPTLPRDSLSQQRDSGQADQRLESVLLFEGRCVSVNAVADGHRPSYLSIREESGRRIGGLTHTTDSPSLTNTTQMIVCTCVLLGISWSPIGFFENVEYYVGLAREEQGIDSMINNVLGPVDARYEERVNERQTSAGSFKIGRGTEQRSIRNHLWFARVWFAVMVSLTLVLAFLFVVISALLSILTFAAFILVVAVAGLLYGFYFGCMRPFWIWSEFHRVAHVLWIEEIAPGVYKRNGVGEIKYPAFERLRPQLTQIKLV